jgi:hypothetical protein
MKENAVNAELKPLAAVIALTLAQGAVAAPTITIKRVPTGLTAAQLQLKLTPILAAQDQERSTRNQQINTQLKSTMSTIDPQRKAISDALAKDPRYKSLLDQASRISNASGDAVTRAAQLKALLGANRVIFTDASRAAGVKESLLNISFKSPGPTKSNPLSTQSSGTAPPLQDLVLQAPYDFETHATDNGGLAFTAAKATSDLDHGTAQIQATIVGVAGNAHGFVQIGNSVSIPAGVHAVEITVSTKADYSGSAFSALGISSAFAECDISIFSADLSNRLATFDDYDSVFAPIGWYQEFSGGENRDHVLTTNIAAGTSSLVVLARVDADSLGTGIPGYSESQSHVEITKIRVHFIAN